MDSAAPIPPPIQDDDEDVHWALSTAAALWGRGERVEALKWLRRAAEQASDVNADSRALHLFKAAADLASEINAGSMFPPPASPVVPPSPESEQSISISMDRTPSDFPAPPPRAPAPSSFPPPRLVARPSSGALPPPAPPRRREPSIPAPPPARPPSIPAPAVAPRPLPVPSAPPPPAHRAAPPPAVAPARPAPAPSAPRGAIPAPSRAGAPGAAAPPPRSAAVAPPEPSRPASTKAGRSEPLPTRPATSRAIEPGRAGQGRRADGSLSGQKAPTTERRRKASLVEQPLPAPEPGSLDGVTERPPAPPTYDEFDDVTRVLQGDPALKAPAVPTVVALPGGRKGTVQQIDDDFRRMLGSRPSLTDEVSFSSEIADDPTDGNLPDVRALLAEAAAAAAPAPAAMVPAPATVVTPLAAASTESTSRKVAPLLSFRVAILATGTPGEVRLVALDGAGQPPAGAAQAILVPLGAADGELVAKLFGALE